MLATEQIIDIAIKLIISVIFGGAVGYLREKEKKAAGLRTHIMVCTGSALFMLISIFTADKYIGADPSRIAAGVVTGIGFLGAGAIIREGRDVRGLTTAASIWICSAIGLATGAGFYEGALITTVLAVFVIEVMQRWEKRFIK